MVPAKTPHTTIVDPLLQPTCYLGTPAASLDRIGMALGGYQRTLVAAVNLGGLRDVIEFNNQGVQTRPQQDPRIHPLDLSADEIMDLEAFLYRLTASNIDYLISEARIVFPDNYRNTLKLPGILTGQDAWCEHCLTLTPPIFRRLRTRI